MTTFSWILKKELIKKSVAPLLHCSTAGYLTHQKESVSPPSSHWPVGYVKSAAPGSLTEASPHCGAAAATDDAAAPLQRRMEASHPPEAAWKFGPALSTPKSPKDKLDVLGSDAMSVKCLTTMLSSWL